MYKLIEHSPGLWFEENAVKNVLKEVDVRPKLSMNLEINGEIYHVCSVFPKNNEFGVRKIQFNDEPEEQVDSDFTCPYCGYIDYDAFELTDDYGTTKCGECGSEIEYEREISIEYRVIPVMKNKAIKI